KRFSPARRRQPLSVDPAPPSRPPRDDLVTGAPAGPRNRVPGLRGGQGSRREMGFLLPAAAGSKPLSVPQGLQHGESQWIGAEQPSWRKQGLKEVAGKRSDGRNDSLIILRLIPVSRRAGSPRR